MKGRLAVVAACLLAGCDRAPDALPLVGTLERERLELVAESSERITDVRVSEGDRVAAGDVLVRLERAVYEAEIRAARAARDRAEQRLAELVRGPRAERIREARARLEGARETRAIQRNEYERVAALVERDLASESELDQAANRLESAEADVEALTATLDELLEGTTVEELRQAEASVAEAEAHIDEIELRAARLEVTAPRPGVIEALPYELGERPPAGAPVVVMLAGGAPYARIYVPEPLHARVEPGTAAEIRVDGVDGSFSGEVRYVASDATFTPYFALTQRDRSRLAFVSEVTLTDPAAAGLPSGVPVQVDFPSLADD